MRKYKKKKKSLYLPFTREKVTMNEMPMMNEIISHWYLRFYEACKNNNKNEYSIFIFKYQSHVVFVIKTNRYKEKITFVLFFFTFNNIKEHIMVCY